MEFSCTCLVTLLITISLKQVKLQPCNSQISSRDSYQHSDNIQLSLRPHRNNLLNNCRFGRIMEMSEERFCFDHCTLNDICVAISISGESCQMCFINDWTSDINLLDTGSRNIYVRMDKLGKLTEKFPYKVQIDIVNTKALDLLRYTFHFKQIKKFARA